MLNPCDHSKYVFIKENKGNLMKHFGELLLEAEGKSITFVDIDETLWATNAKIYVMKDGDIKKKLTNTQFNTYQLKDGESFDFSEFSSTDIFVNTSSPIEAMIKKVNAMFKNINRVGSEMYLLTARADFDDKEKLLNYIKTYGLEVGHKNDNKIHIIRAGNYAGSNSAERKKTIINEFLKTGKYYKTRLYDDAISNLDAFMELSEDYEHVIFEAYHIDHGEVKRYRK